MDSAKYHQLSNLPEPDYLDVELEKIYGPPPSRLPRLRKWARRNICLLTFLALSLIATVLFFGAQIAAKPKLVGIIRPEDSNPPVSAALLNEDQVPDGLWGASPPESGNNGDRITIDVAGSEVTAIVGGEIVPVSGGNITEIAGSPEDAGNSQKENSKEPTKINESNEGSKTSTENQSTADTMPAKSTEASSAAQKVAGEPAASKDPSKVSISNAATEEQEPLVPIRATFYSSVEGPKACRGHAIAIIDLPKPPKQEQQQQQQGLGSDGVVAAPAAASSVPTAPRCFNFAGEQTSSCALFMANKADGCVAQVYAQTNCRTYMNTVAFMPEQRPVGGKWLSVMVQCGVPEPDPATLGKPPGMDQMATIVDHDKAKGG